MCGLLRLNLEVYILLYVASGLLNFETSLWIGVLVIYVGIRAIHPASILQVSHSIGSSTEINFLTEDRLGHSFGSCSTAKWSILTLGVFEDV